MAELFGVVKSTINEHLSIIYETGELDKEATVRNFRTVQKEGERSLTRNLEYYNLDVIISVGYRVNSTQTNHFRKWATKILREFLVKGFVLDDERLKQGKALSKNLTHKNQLVVMANLLRIITLYIKLSSENRNQG